MRILIARELRKARVLRELSKTELTELSGLSLPTILKIEKGYPVKWESIERYAKTLGYRLTFKLEKNEY